MMSQSDRAIKEYVNSLLLDVSYADIAKSAGFSFKAKDSIISGQRLQVLDDVFSQMTLNAQQDQHRIWLSVLALVEMLEQLPNGQLKSYALNQCQTLMTSLDLAET